MHIFKKLSVEAYVLGIIPALGSIALFFIDPRLAEAFFAHPFRSFVYYFFLGGKSVGAFIFGFLFLLYLYLFARLSVGFAQRAFGRGGESFWRGLRIMKSAAFFMVITGSMLLFQELLNAKLGEAPLLRIVAASDSLMEADRRFFGVYPAFAMQGMPDTPFFAFFGTLLVRSFEALTPFIVLAFAILIARPRLFRRFVLSFLLSSAFGFLVWFSFPALSPHDRYLDNILAAPIPASVKRAVPPPAAFHPALSELLARVRERKEEAGRFRSLTTLASMHVAWAAEIAYFVTRAWPPFGAALIPWAALNAVAISYTNQHYAVDAVVGFLVAAIAVILTDLLLLWERRAGKKEAPPHLEFVDAAREDARAFARYLRRLPWNAR